VIALLRGEVAVRRGDHVVIVCDGVGYRTAVSAETLRHVPAVGEQVTLHTHLIVRDDALALYGFHAEQERDLFLMLLAVQAVGPKVALAVLSAGRPRELVSALAAGDAARFQAVPGIGKRTAERIIVELREKVLSEDWALPEPVGEEDAPGAPAIGGEDGTPRGAGGERIVARRGEQPHPRTLAREGLIELGYGPGEAEELLRELDDESAEDLIAGALRLARSGG
jgi:Holliday junction DNA helicase RuvA